MSEQVFEDKSIEAALEQAATALGVPVDELQYELVDEKAGDFWGLGETMYSVRAWPRAADSPPEPEPVATDSAEQGEVAAVSEGEPAAAGDAPATPPAALGDASPDELPADTGPSAPDDTGDTDTGAAETSAADTADTDTGDADLPAFFRDDGDAPAAEDVADDTATDGPVEAADTLAAAEVAPPPTAPTEAPPAKAEPDAAATGATDVSDEATGLLDKIFETMGFDCEAQGRLDGETLQIAITGDDNQYLLDGRGRGLSALELILNHAFRHRPDRAHRRVRVDAGDFRSQRDDEIRDMAYQVAHQAKETDAPQQTGPLNPYERRIVHLTLAEDPKVETRSIGTGFQKAVNVIPTSRGRRH